MLLNTRVYGNQIKIRNNAFISIEHKWSNPEENSEIMNKKNCHLENYLLNFLMIDPRKLLTRE